MDYEKVEQIVFEFYKQATTDILIGFHFRHIVDFSSHIPRIAKFWDQQLNGTIYKFSPPLELMATHQLLKITQGQLNRWVLLFKKTLSEQELTSVEDKIQLQRWEKKLEQFQKMFLNSPKLWKQS